MPVYLLADWYADAVEPVTPFRRRTPPTVECRTRKTEWGERRRSSPRVDSVRLGGKLRDVKRPACFSVADRRVSKLRPWLCVSYAAGMLNRSGRKTHSDRLGEDEAQKALHPQSPAGEAINCPAGEAINSNHRTGARREKDLRQTPTAGRGPRTKDLRQTSSFRPVLLAESYVKSAAAAVPSWETFQRANHPSSQTRATGIAPPGFYGRKPWLKAKQCRHYYPPKTRCEGSRAVHANIVHKTSRKFTGRRRGTTRRAISTRVRGSACAETHAFSALSACRRALSCAS